MMARKMLILSEEASGAIKTLKRLEHTNPSVRMDEWMITKQFTIKHLMPPADSLCL